MAEVREATSQFDVLKQALLTTHSRYNWSGEHFGFEEGRLDLPSLIQDLERMKKLRAAYGWKLLKGEEIKSDPSAASLFVTAARIVYSRYIWGDKLSFRFTEMLAGNVQEVRGALAADFEAIYEARKRYEREGFPTSLTANYRVFTTIEGLLFQAIRSLGPFSKKRPQDPGRYTRVLRCLEGVLFQMIRTLDPAFSTREV